MQYSFSQSLEILERTPDILLTMLGQLSTDWTNRNEGENTWTPKEVVAHLIVCEETNWMPRTRIILYGNSHESFVPIDMNGHVEMAANNALPHLLNTFKQQRENNLKELNAFKINEQDLLKTAMHPRIGQVNLQQLMATWVTHDLSHLSQISRIMAKQNKENVGPFSIFFSAFNT